MRFEKTVEEMVRFIKEKKNNTPNFKWTSTNGQALESVLLILDKEFFDHLILHLEQREARCKSLERNLEYKESELETREKALAEKEATTSYPFESSVFRDAYLMSEALKKEFTGQRGGIDPSVACRIVEMVEKLIQAGGSNEG